MVLTELVNKNCVVNTYILDLYKSEQNISFPDKCCITDVRISGDSAYITAIQPHDTQFSNRLFRIERGDSAFVYQFNMDLVGTDMKILADAGFEMFHIFMKRR
jgi:hypothetical protein